MKKILTLITLAFLLTSCGKEFLEKKQNRSQVVPADIADFQALLDDATRTINTTSCNELGLIGSDEYYLTDESWKALSSVATSYERKGYYWAKDNVYEGAQVRDWDYAYRRILYANTAIEGIEKIKPSQTDQDAWNNVKGSALFIRAYAFYQLAQEFCKPFNLPDAGNDLGILLRLKPDVVAKVPRSTVKETYDRILSDLTGAVELLPNVALLNYRPSKAAAYALLAKTYLLMGEYQEAGKNAGNSLSLSSELINYNTLDLNSGYCFPLDMQDNPEILYVGYILNIPIFRPLTAIIDPEIYQLYENNDLGKNAYFTTNQDGTISFKGSYFGSEVPLFTGLAVDEVILIKAECSARNNDLVASAEELNQLLKNRFETATFVPISFSTKEEAIREILNQRRIRLVLRGTRWEDLRRLNLDPAYRKTLKRILNGVTYELLPNDSKYVWPIPEKAIEFGNYQQNPR